MDEQVTWKGQSFTLLVFGGIVFLCSIFFVLGMLVGRGQGKSAAEADKGTASATSAPKDPLPQDPKPASSSYQSITVGKEANKEIKQAETKPSEPTPSKPPAPDKPAKVPPKTEPPAPAKAPAAKTATASPAKITYLQVNAVTSEAAAKKQVTDLEKAGFRAVIMGGDGANALYKVQVGPFATTADADSAKRKLEALGYKPIKK